MPQVSSRNRRDKYAYFSTLIYRFVPIAASLALLDQPNLTAEEIVRKSMKIAGDICVYTNHNLTVEKIEPKVEEANKNTLL